MVKKLLKVKKSLLSDNRNRQLLSHFQSGDFKRFKQVDGRDMSQVASKQSVK